ncbi:MAG TPA: carboxypeptidase regulatory-like domain-containing protein [Pirellulaceae bacterium]|nr:carboxypeptidase regulatory-like domain-containing protein [Pirellulaceae bacterium]
MKCNYGAVGLLLLLFASGCGGGSDRPKLAPVKGQVTLDGVAVKDAAVMFMPTTGRPAMGATDAAGNFELMTYDPGDGALLGDHKVTVTLKKLTGVVSSDGLSGTAAPGGIQEEWLVPERYSKPETSGLTAKVEPRMAPLEFKLTK